MKNKIKNYIKENITEQNLLCLFIVLGPIFDIASFLFRNYFETNFSISTFLRPIIPIIVLIIIFFKSDKKQKLKLFLIGLMYIVYAVVHLLISKTLFTGCSYGTIYTEIQYICNFTFIMIDFVAFYYTFKVQKYDSEDVKEKKELGLKKLKKSITIMLAIYVFSIFLAIITKTSSYTYSETSTGYKGWIESGNSLSAILCTACFISIGQIKSSKLKWKIFTIVTLIATGIYLIFLIGTRTGLLGFIGAVFAFTLFEMLFNKNKKVAIFGGIFLAIAIIAVVLVGSKTFQRRKQLDEAANRVDETTGEVTHMSTDMLDIYNKIIDGTLEEGYMSEPQKQATIDLYEFTKTHNIANNDNRIQQLMYNIFLVKHQKNPITILFGNGFNTNFREMCMENEIPSFLLNFGIVGFILYIGTFIAIFIYAIKNLFKNFRKIDSGFMMYLSACAFVLLLSTLAGLVFFASSSMAVIVALNIFLLDKIDKINK